MLQAWRHMMSFKQGDIVSIWFPDSNLLTVKKRLGHRSPKSQFENKS